MSRIPLRDQRGAPYDAHQAISSPMALYSSSAPPFDSSSQHEEKGDTITEDTASMNSLSQHAASLHQRSGRSPSPSPYFSGDSHSGMVPHELLRRHPSGEPYGPRGYALSPRSSNIREVHPDDPDAPVAIGIPLDSNGRAIAPSSHSILVDKHSRSRFEDGAARSRAYPESFASGEDGRSYDEELNSRLSRDRYPDHSEDMRYLQQLRPGYLDPRDCALGGRGRYPGAEAVFDPQDNRRMPSYATNYERGARLPPSDFDARPGGDPRNRFPPDANQYDPRDRYHPYPPDPRDRYALATYDHPSPVPLDPRARYPDEYDSYGGARPDPRDRYPTDLYDRYPGPRDPGVRSLPPTPPHPPHPDDRYDYYRRPPPLDLRDRYSGLDPRDRGYPDQFDRFYDPRDRRYVDDATRRYRDDRYAQDVLNRPGAEPNVEPGAFRVDPRDEVDRRYEAKLKNFTREGSRSNTSSSSKEDPYTRKLREFGVVGKEAGGEGSQKSASARRSNSPLMVGIGPGVQVALRDTKETVKAIEKDFYIPICCLSCSEDLFCIADVSYFICPKCKCINPCEAEPYFEGNPIERHGVGLGFDIDNLFKMQAKVYSRNTREISK